MSSPRKGRRQISAAKILAVFLSDRLARLDVLVVPTLKTFSKRLLIFLGTALAYGFWLDRPGRTISLFCSIASSAS